MRKFIAALCLLAATPFVHAGDSAGLVESHLAGVNGKLFFIAGPHNNAPACAVHGWAVDLVGPNAAAGKAILAVMLAAKYAGKTVRVTGTGACDVWGDRETVLHIVVF